MSIWVYYFREPLKIHFGGQANLFAAGLCQTKVTLASTKADLSSLPDGKNLLLAAQKQLLELPLILAVDEPLLQYRYLIYSILLGIWFFMLGGNFFNYF